MMWNDKNYFLDILDEKIIHIKKKIFHPNINKRGVKINNKIVEKI